MPHAEALNEKIRKGLCECGKPVHSRGMCNTCYARQHRSGRAMRAASSVQ